MSRITRDAGAAAGIHEKNHVTWKCEHGHRVTLRKSLVGILLSSTLSQMYVVKDGCDICKGQHPNLSPGWQAEKKSLTPPQSVETAPSPGPLVPAE